MSNTKPFDAEFSYVVLDSCTTQKEQFRFVDGNSSYMLFRWAFCLTSHSRYCLHKCHLLRESSKTDKRKPLFRSQSTLLFILTTVPRGGQFTSPLQIANHSLSPYTTHCRQAISISNYRVQFAMAIISLYLGL